MLKRIIETERAPAPIGPYSQAVFVNGFLYTSGQIAIDPNDGTMKTEDIAEETHLVMENLAAVLQEAGMDFSHVIKCSIFLDDMDDFPEVNKVYSSYFEKNPPARETVEVSHLPRDAHVEISLIAFRAD